MYQNHITVVPSFLAHSCQRPAGNRCCSRGHLAVSLSNCCHGEVWLLWNQPHPLTPSLPLCSVSTFPPQLSCTPPCPITPTPPPHAHLDITQWVFVIYRISSFSSTPLPHSLIKINTLTSSCSHDALWVFSSCCFTVAEPAGFDL